MTLGTRIAKLRKESGLSQEAFAEKIGVSRQAVSKWESDASVPDVDRLVQISALFGVSLDSMIKGEADDEAPFPEQQGAPQPTDEPEMPPADEPEPQMLPDESAYSSPDAYRIRPEAAQEAPPEAPVFLPPEAPPVPKNAGGKKKHIAVRVLAVLLVLCLLVGGTLLELRYEWIREAWWSLNGGKVRYPYVLVHGLGGWGTDSGMNEQAPYWGAGTGDLVSYLNAQGYEVCAPSVGPVSSTWDRACELYAQLTGTTVDYGEAHAIHHNHARFGRTYTTALVPNWGQTARGFQRVKINLVGHSFGGATIRLLTSLLAYGNKAEQAATGKETSPLFTGGKGNWVNSVTTLCAPHNGSSLTCVLDTLGGLIGVKNTTQLLAHLCFTVAGAITPFAGSYDFMLNQFGISQTAGTLDSLGEAISQLIAKGNDHAGYDLSPDGAKALNETIQTVKGVYYFSYSYCTTKTGTLIQYQVPVSGTLPVLMPTAMAIGAYQGKTPGGIEITADWQPNDGLVSVVSAQYPLGEAYSALPQQADDARAYRKGVWYVEETLQGDHGTVIGLNAEADATHAFWNAHFSLVDALRR